MTNETSTTTETAAVAEQGANVAPEKAASTKKASSKKSAPKGQKAAKKAAAKKEAKPATKKAAKKETKPAARGQQKADRHRDDASQGGRDDGRDCQSDCLAKSHYPGLRGRHAQEDGHHRRIHQERLRRALLLDQVDSLPPTTRARPVLAGLGS